MAGRKLKVYEKYRSLVRSYRVVPEMRLCGLWLDRSGFKIGDEVELMIRDQEILIRHVNPKHKTDGDH